MTAFWSGQRPEGERGWCWEEGAEAVMPGFCDAAERWAMREGEGGVRPGPGGESLYTLLMLAYIKSKFLSSLVLQVIYWAEVSQCL